MKKIYYYFVPLLILLIVSGCSVTKYEARTFKGVRPNVMVLPLVADVDVDITKKIKGTGSAKTELAAKEEAVYKAIDNSGADVIVDPIFIITVSGRTVKADVTGFYGKYKEIRNASESDLDKLTKYNEAGGITTMKSGGTIFIKKRKK